MAKPSYETLQKKVSRLEKEVARLRSSRRRDDEKYYDLAENVNSIILRMDTEGGITFFNEYARNFFGYSSDEIIGRNVVGTIVPESESTGRDLAGVIRDICSNPESYVSNENENMKKDGSRVWISWSNRALADTAGTVTGILCVGNDITGLKKAEQAARESEERYRVLYNSSVNIMYMHDFTGKFLDANDTGLKLIGYDREELKTLNFKDLLGPDQERSALEKTAKILAADHTTETVEYRLRAKGGEEKYVEVNASLLTHDGEPYGVLGIARDITAQKMALAALRESEEKFYKAFNKSPLLIAINDMDDLGFVDVNDRFLEVTGYRRDEIIGRSPVDLKLYHDEEELAAVVADTLKNGSVRDVNLWIRSRSGEIRKGIFTADIINLGQKRYFLTMMNDVTERLTAEEELRKNEAVLRSMLEAVPVGVGLLVNRKFIKVNASLCEITGFTEEEMIGQYTRILYPDDSEYLRIGRELYIQMQHEGRGVQDATLRRKDGRMIDVMLCLSPFDPNNMETGVTATVLDITERNRVARALRESEQKFRLLAENARDVIWQTDLDLKPTYISNSITRLCGYTPEEMLGMSLDEILAPRSRELGIRENIENAAIEKSGAGDPNRTVTLELEFNRKDGSTVWTESIVTYQRDPDGRALTIVGVTRDITERRLIQAENEIVSLISRLFLSPGSVSEIYEGIPAILSGHFNCPVAAIMQYDSAEDEIIYLGSTGIPWEGPGRHRLPAGETISGQVVKTGEAVVEIDLPSRPDYRTPAFGELGVKTFICVPIFIGGAAFGAMAIGDIRIRTEAPRMASTMRIIADYFSREILRRHIEETLKESEELTRNLMASVNEGVIIFNRDFRILLWNRFMEELTGVPAGEVIGKIYTDFFPHIKNRAVLDDMKRALAGDLFRSDDIEFEFARSARKGWMIGQYTPLRNSRDEIIGIIVSIRDITRRKMAEFSLGRTQEDLSETLEATTDGIWTWNARDDEYYYSPRFYSMLGYKPGDFPPTFAGFKSLIHPDDLERALGIMRNYISSGQADVYENEYRLKTRDGSYRWIYSRARVVERDQAGHALRLIGNHEDITDRKSAEDRLKGQLAVNMALAGLSGSIISQSYTINDVAIIVLEYARLLTDSEEGYVSEISGETGDTVILAKIMKTEDAHLRRKGLWGHPLDTRHAFFTNSPPEHELWKDMPGGSARIERFLSVPVLFYNELVGQIIVANASRDYTENDLVTVRHPGSLFAMAINRIRSESRIMESLHEKEVLIKELHHRVKNNMQVISSLLGLQSRKIDDEKYRRYFEESQNRIHAMAMVHEKLYRSEDMARVDFSEYINELTRHLFYTYNVNRETVRLSIDAGAIYLGIDTAIPCAMIINELVSNTLKHAFPDGRAGELKVGFVMNASGKNVLTVSDNGIGLPEGFDIATANSLGMQIVQSLARQIKGTLDLTGSGGTRIEIVF